MGPGSMAIRRRGFTLIELLIALAVIALAVVFALQRFSAAQTQSIVNADMAQAQAVMQALSAFYAVNGCYPADVGPGQMPAGLSPYLGGQWPGSATWPSSSTTYDYNAWTSVSPPMGASSGQTAYYIGVSIYEPRAGGWLGNPPWNPWMVSNSPVPIC
jgi:prepilin-type N-terminal cleavage/methylation domain-containing protein